MNTPQRLRNAGVAASNVLQREGSECKYRGCSLVGHFVGEVVEVHGHFRFKLLKLLNSSLARGLEFVGFRVCLGFC